MDGKNMQDLILQIAIYGSIANLLVVSEPANFIKSRLKISPKSRFLLMRILAQILNCALCSGFWVGLLISQDFYVACLSSVCAAFIFKQT